jgi:hypothetical protein
MAIPAKVSDTMSSQKSLPGLPGEWEIASRGSRCSRTGVAFKPNESFYTILFELPDGGFRREDFSEQAWIEYDHSSQEKPFSFWKSRYQPPPPPEEETLPTQSAEMLLRTLLSSPEPTQQAENTCYILALMLERKRTLRQVDSKRSGNRLLLIYEHAKTGEVFIVKDPQLRLDEIEDVQREVSAILNGAPTTREG